MSIINLTGGAKEFQPVPSFPLGSNSFDYSSNYKCVCNNVSNTSAAIAVVDIQQVAYGAVVTVDVECRTISGSGGSVSIDTRTAPGLGVSRKTVALNSFLNTEWELVTLTWVVCESGRFVNVNIGGSTGGIGVYEFRNPRIKVTGGNSNAGSHYRASLLRVGGSWSLDTVNFPFNGGVYIKSITGDSLVIGYDHTGDFAPVVTISVDTGSDLTALGYVSAGPHSVNEQSASIRLISPSGAYLSDVTSGGTTRLHVTISF